MPRILCFNRCHERRPALSDDRAGRTLRESRDCRAFEPARRVRHRSRPSRAHRCGNGAAHSASRISHRVDGGTRPRGQARDRHRRRRHDALHRAAARSVRRAADRHQSGSPGLSDRHRRRRHGERTCSDARGRLRRTDANAARCDTRARPGRQRARAGAQRRLRQPWRGRRHDRMRGDDRWTLRLRDARRRPDRRDAHRLDRLRAVRAGTDRRSGRCRISSGTGCTARADQSAPRSARFGRDRDRAAARQGRRPALRRSGELPAVRRRSRRRPPRRAPGAVTAPQGSRPLRHAAAEASLERDTRKFAAAIARGPRRSSFVRSPRIAIPRELRLRPMLRLLSIRNFAVVEALEIEFEPGFTVLTGETGAGKSILLDALSLLLGGRFESRQLRPGSERAEIAAEFDLADAPGLRAWVDEQDLADDGPLLLRRTLDAQGRSRAWINGRPATLQQLGDAGANLVDLHGQHAYESLARPETQRQLVDAFGGFTALSREVAAAWRAWREAKERRARGERDAATRLAERDALAARAAELSALGATAAEWQELSEAQSRLANAASLLEAAAAGVAELIE